ncbi:hypothetical protein V6N13_045687 [Hibiscus sabdariffa]
MENQVPSGTSHESRAIEVLVLESHKLPPIYTSQRISISHHSSSSNYLLSSFFNMASNANENVLRRDYDGMCHLCGVTGLRNNAALDRHQWNRHEDCGRNKLKYHCSQSHCVRRFRTKEDMKEHMDNGH